jgi:CheY-like chemotaxis protein
MPGRQVNILLVEDDEIEAEAVIRSFQKHALPNPITVAQDGIEALGILRHQTHWRANPYMILLDLNMPRMSGIEFLQEIRRDAHLKRSIIFVLTTSNRDEDKIAAYNHQVAGYLVKSQLGDDFQRLTEILHIYWQTIEFPPLTF